MRQPSPETVRSESGGSSCGSSPIPPQVIINSWICLHPYTNLTNLTWFEFNAFVIFRIRACLLLRPLRLQVNLPAWQVLAQIRWRLVPRSASLKKKLKNPSSPPLKQVNFLLSPYLEISLMIAFFHIIIEKRFSFLSEDEVNKLRQEEGNFNDYIFAIFLKVFNLTF